MKQKKCIVGILLLGAVCAQANNYEVTSPDGRLAVKVECVDGKAFYSVELNGKQMLKPSALGLVANYGGRSLNLSPSLFYVSIRFFRGLVICWNYWFLKTNPSASV